jgi:CheY-like chemotaxis protein
MQPHPMLIRWILSCGDAECGLGHRMPAIIRLLGYDPLPIGRNWAERLVVCRTALGTSGFEVTEAGGGSAALEAVRATKNRIDVMLLDVTLPGLSSRVVMEEARLVRPKLKVILTSAYSRETVDASFAGLRIERFLRKPFQFLDLIGLLQEALST